MVETDTRKAAISLRQILDLVGNLTDSQVKTKRFANRTHAIEYALEQLRRDNANR